MTSVLGYLGQAMVLAGLAAATAGAVVGFVAGYTGTASGWAWTRRLAYLFGACMVAATVVMEVALLTHDFSVKYVAQVGSKATPAYITVVSLWSSLEGSILFWGAVLGVYVMLATWINGTRNGETMPYATATWLVVGAFFCFLMAGPANPFWPVPNPIPTDGPGPNALLQNHWLMIIHPPMLYLGYVGMTIPFGLAVASLLYGGLGPGQLSQLRSWLVVPFGFLSAGIVLGGWWAYEVLGWGGYWAWDPVENASFLPWLTATAALHAALLPARRAMMKGWTTVLVIASFLLTILGTFMTRSGVFNSVHSFSQSDIGPTILVFLGGTLVFSVGLLAVRMDSLASEGRVRSLVSREAAFLVNNAVFVAFTFMVLVGTVFPLLAEAIRGVKVSVGEPYYNRYAVPLSAMVVFLMGVGPALPWGQASWDKVRAQVLVPAIVGLAAVLGGWVLGVRDPWPALLLGLIGFAGVVTGREIVAPFRADDVAGALSRGRRRMAGYIVHAGILVLVFGVAMSSAYRTDKEFRVPVGQAIEFEGYTLTYAREEKVTEPHRTGERAVVQIARGGSTLGDLTPTLWTYPRMGQPIGSPDVRSTLTHDLYVSLMSIDPAAGVAGLHVFHNPMIAWIWIGAGIVAAGSALAAWPARSKARAAAPAPAADVVAQAGK